jgi:hypothetical protein
MKSFILLPTLLFGAIVCRGQNHIGTDDTKNHIKQIIDSIYQYSFDKYIITGKTKLDTTSRDVIQVNFNRHGKPTLEIKNDFPRDSTDFTYDSTGNLLSENEYGDRLTVYERDTLGHLTEIDKGWISYDSVFHKQNFEPEKKTICQCDSNGNVIKQSSDGEVIYSKYNKDNYETELDDSISTMGVDLMKGLFITLSKYDSRHNLIERDYPKGHPSVITWAGQVGKELYLYNKHNDCISEKYIDTRNGEVISYDTTKYFYDSFGSWVESIRNIYLHGSKEGIIIQRRKIVYY